MPKKHQRNPFRKPPSTAHPSLSSPPTPSATTSAPASTSPSSVNQLLTKLRENQTPPVDADVHDIVALATARTVHPSLRNILDVAEIPPPRPRPIGPGLGRRTRGPAGYPPPMSWLMPSKHAPAHLRARRGRSSTAPDDNPRPTKVNRLPGIPKPAENTLLHFALKALARDWEWQVHFNRYHLATLPSELKPLLLAYIAFHGPGTGVGIDGLRTLFLPEADLIDATPTEDITRLDLACAIGHSVTLNQLSNFLSPSQSLYSGSTPTPKLQTPLQPSKDLEDSWETAASEIELSSLSLSASPFPNLTHLSLSHPNPAASWTRLLKAASSFHTITHLSLAYWPVPSLTPNAKTTSLQSAYSPSVNYGGTDFYSASEGDWSEAAGLLRRLSRATYCLKWLDLEGCGEWLDALKWAVEDEGTEWNGGWRAVEKVILTPGSALELGEVDGRCLPVGVIYSVEEERNDWQRKEWQLGLLAQKLNEHERRAIEVASWVRKKRAAAGGLYCRFIIKETDALR